MTDIGFVKKLEAFAGQRIVAVELSDPSNLKLSTGQELSFGGREGVIVTGWKFWADSSIIDVLLEDDHVEIHLCDRVTMIART